MKALYALALVILSGAALADGVPLLSAAPQNKALVQKYQALGKSGTAVKVNPYALDSNVIVVALAGKTYRFVGGKTEATMTAIHEGKVGEQPVTTWRGTAGPSELLTLSRVGTTVTGNITMPSGNYELTGDNVLVSEKSERMGAKETKK